MYSARIGKLFELYFDVFDKFGLHLLNESDEILSRFVFEETEISIGLCSKHILRCLLYEGILDQRICEESLLLYTMFRKLNDTDLWNLESVKYAPEWRAVMEQSDKIKELIQQRWTEEELKILFADTRYVNYCD